MRILFLTHRLPYAPNRGDRLRAYHILRHLHGQAEVDLVSLVHDDDEASHAGDLAAFTASTSIVRVPRLRTRCRAAVFLPTRRPTTHTLLDGPGLEPTLRRVVSAARPDLVFAYCSGVAHAAFGATLRAFPLVVDMVDVDSEKWADLAGAASWPMSWIYRREAGVLSAFERILAERAKVTFITTDREREALLKLAPGARIVVMQNGVDVDYWRPREPAVRMPTVVFCGVMNYAPNVEAALWLAKNVWPRVKSLVPHARLQIVGASPTTAVQGLAASDVEVTGYVPDVRPYLWRARVAVAPLQRARGVQNKVLEAVSAGAPVVVTPVVHAGLPIECRSSCVRADDAEAFAVAIVDALSTELGGRGGDERAATLSWASRLAPMMEQLQMAASGEG